MSAKELTEKERKNLKSRQRFSDILKTIVFMIISFGILAAILLNGNITIKDIILSLLPALIFIFSLSIFFKTLFGYRKKNFVTITVSEIKYADDLKKKSGITFLDNTVLDSNILAEDKFEDKKCRIYKYSTFHPEIFEEGQKYTVQIAKYSLLPKRLTKNGKPYGIFFEYYDDFDFEKVIIQ